MRYLKRRKDSDALAYQRHVQKHLKARARVMNVSDPIVRPLKLRKGAPDSAVAAEIETWNERYTTLMRFLAQTDVSAVESSELQAVAKAYVEVKGVRPGELYGIDSVTDIWDSAIDSVFEHYQYQDHPQYREVYPNAKRMPVELRDAILSILTSKDTGKKFHLFSDALDAYKAYRAERIERESQTSYERSRKLSELKKDLRRLDDFYEFAGNQEFTTEYCNEELQRYRRHLLDQFDKPATAKRHHEVPCAALRWYAEEHVPSVVIRQFKFQGQKAKAEIRPVLDLESELGAVWAAAHDSSYHHLFRLAAFGIFAGAGASELIQTQVEDVHVAEGYYVLAGSKTLHRARPAIILNRTHEALLLKHKEGSIAGHKTAHQTSSNHSKIIKDGLIRATGNSAISAYSTRHTGKYLCDVAGIGSTDPVRIMFGWHEGGYAIANNYGRAGHFARPMIDQMKKVIEQMTADLPDLDRSSLPPINTGNVAKMHW